MNWGFITPTVLSMLDPAGCPAGGRCSAAARRCPPNWPPAGPPAAALLNSYGPTETTVLAVSGELTAAETDPVPIGLPLPNHRAYVVDDDAAGGAAGGDR